MSLEFGILKVPLAKRVYTFPGKRAGGHTLVADFNYTRPGTATTADNSPENSTIEGGPCR